MAKFLVRAGAHLEPDPTDKTFKQENRPQRERMYHAGDVFESPKNRVKQHGDKFQRVSDDTKVTSRPVVAANAETDLDVAGDDAAPAQTATVTAYTEDQLGKMSFADLKAHCDAAGIDLKGSTDRKKVIQLIIDDQSA